MMDLRDTLVAFGEWLDSQGLVIPASESDDPRSYDELAADFQEEWEGAELPD